MGIAILLLERDHAFARGDDAIRIEQHRFGAHTDKRGDGGDDRGRGSRWRWSGISYARRIRTTEHGGADKSEYGRCHSYGNRCRSGACLSYGNFATGEVEYNFCHYRKRAISG